jgi:hypothetical protein
MNFEWQKLDDTRSGDTYRAKVYDGWLVRERYDAGVSITFIPDPRHIWKVEDTSLPLHHQYVCAICDTIYPNGESHSCAA